MRVKLLKFFNVAAVAVLVTLIYADLSHAASVNLTWDASPSPGVTGNKIGIGTDSTLSLSTLLVANVTAAAVTDLTPGVTYYFGVKAFNADAESAWSNIVTYTPPISLEPPVAIDPANSVPPSLFSVKTPLGIKVIFVPGWIKGTTQVVWSFPGGSPASSSRTTNGTSSTTYPGPGEYAVTFTHTVYGAVQSETKTLVLSGSGYAFK